MIENDYEVVVADTRETRRIHHRIRYQVYCLETGYEDPHAYPDGLERDEWDEHAIPFLVRHRPTEQWIGTMRLIPSMERGLPFFSLLSPEAEVDRFKAERAYEISRVCIPSVYRRRNSDRVAARRAPERCDSVFPSDGFRSLLRNEGVIRGMKMRPWYSWSGGADSGECLDIRALRGELDQRFRHCLDSKHWGSCTAPNVDGNAVIAVLFRAAIRTASQKGVEALFFLVRPSLARILRRFQFQIERVGQGCEHRGLRFPYRAEVSPDSLAMTASMSQQTREDILPKHSTLGGTCI
ncbi:GNAT family N-acyltransferase [Ectothiorhodospira shaposhnikovii]|uniref:GNAT family N-acyltransferase n=1 Tax=Ectothiorhodospira shaposhnikovii TaxID=1054 RepID=UPI001EE80482|nr:GNAT family N-acyltransferase [Ectothiorhodospira shaposhnikovii]MCG5512184.1 GNAT family N-acetyltransferase [Ectothiorhodospira shaposhnikovii]